MTLFEKTKWVLGIVLVFLLVLTTNLIDRRNFRDVKASIEAIYADRLVAQDILFEIYKVINRKELVYSTQDPADLGDVVGADQERIATAVDRFAATRLTERETLLFNQLRENLTDLSGVEKDLPTGTASRREVIEAVHRVEETLDELTAIQMQEGRRQLLMGQEAISSSDLFTQLEIGALVILALGVQVIILYSPGSEQRRSVD
ncbi:chemoreceptor-like protein with four helix bundle sensory module [Neolewinella xylanilytica]|uniref:Chemoreceptor-like protein with four helix bundle sensory module n=1 Tax=Neolewinella xylanilytica TaxID=1514080 RepID=A0A2S6I1R9_9BACT|nr:MCP four helix bundle domain-containing protein [Neolewinella xylanilytica]PPK85125.1 chemoreceptor-like protein with four helix bundle sensory module [Neolewinella xylanilytica]